AAAHEAARDDHAAARGAATQAGTGHQTFACRSTPEATQQTTRVSRSTLRADRISMKRTLAAVALASATILSQSLRTNLALADAAAEAEQLFTQGQALL